MDEVIRFFSDVMKENELTDEDLHNAVYYICCISGSRNCLKGIIQYAPISTPKRMDGLLG